MMRDSKVVDGKLPGQAIRFPVEPKGRWEPQEKESYLERIVASEVPFDDGIAGQGPACAEDLPGGDIGRACRSTSLPDLPRHCWWASYSC